MCTFSSWSLTGSYCLKFHPNSSIYMSPCPAILHSTLVLSLHSAPLVSSLCFAVLNCLLACSCFRTYHKLLGFLWLVLHFKFSKITAALNSSYPNSPTAALAWLMHHPDVVYSSGSGEMKVKMFIWKGWWVIEERETPWLFMNKSHWLPIHHWMSIIYFLHGPFHIGCYGTYASLLPWLVVLLVAGQLFLHLGPVHALFPLPFILAGLSLIKTICCSTTCDTT